MNVSGPTGNDSGADTRAAAARAVDGVVNRRRSMERAMSDAGVGRLDERDRAFVTALVFGTLRRHYRHQLIINELVQKPLRMGDSVVNALLSVALFQLTESHHPPYAVVSAAVAATAKVNRPRLRGLVNATLRRFLRERDDLMPLAMATDEGRYCHPDWIICRVRDDWPEQWEPVLSAGARQAGMWIRVNRQRIARDEYREILLAHLGQEGRILDGLADAICLDEPVPVDELPGFRNGEVTVQDAASQVAAELLAPDNGMRVLDACAAPGGKTTHILERFPAIAELVAVDESSARLERLRENLERIKLDATIKIGDALLARRWWDGKPFQRILLDAPCSASGVIRRHPDIAWLRRNEDVDALARRQEEMLEALWPLLDEGGQLLYATCSLFKRENSDVIAAFLNTHSDAVEVQLSHECLLSLDTAQSPHGRQMLPGTGDTDGFYYALMERKAP